MKHNLYVGKRVLWRFKPRGGYGFVLRVPVRIDVLTENRATITIESTGVSRIVSLRSIIDPPSMVGAKAEVVP